MLGMFGDFTRLLFWVNVKTNIGEALSRADHIHSHINIQHSSVKKQNFNKFWSKNKVRILS